MAIKTGAIKAGGSEVYPHTALDQIRKSATSSTTLIAPGGVIQKDYLDLTGLISTSYVSSANIIPASAINGLPTAVANAASTYVNSSGVIPTSAVVDLPFISSSYALFAENGWTRWVSAGAGVTVTENTYNFPERDVTIALKDFDTIETATTGATVTIAPGKAYRIDATTSSKTLAISSYNAGLWGRESHIELFVANTGYVHVGSNVTLVDALEPDAVNNLTVRFHDGHAIISVEDHVEAYLVNITGTGSATAGTLAYGLKQTGNTYQFIGFRSELNTSSVPTGGATATVLKHIVGNGMNVGPTITGVLNANSRVTIRDAKLDNSTLTGYVHLDAVNLGAATISGGTTTLANMVVTSGATVTIGTNGKIGFDAGIVDGTDAVINLNGNASSLVVNTYAPQTTRAVIKGLTITGGYSTGGAGALNLTNRHADFISCTITGNQGTTGGGITTYATADCTFTSCIITGNTGTNGTGMFPDQAVISGCIVSGNFPVGGNDIRFTSSAASVLIKDSTIGICAASRGILTLDGSNRIDAIHGASATVNILSGTSIMLTTSISNAAVVVSSGGCVVNGATIAAGTYTKITSVGGSASGTLA